mmetsp:Transcript_38229/g.79499  ORF Transcript_38229/g.79499 Transcript_38229/m.79499 type:complete len:135 (+) Transcript_38229:970-1374(+)
MTFGSVELEQHLETAPPRLPRFGEDGVMQLRPRHSQTRRVDGKIQTAVFKLLFPHDSSHLTPSTQHKPKLTRRPYSTWRPLIEARRRDHRRSLGTRKSNLHPHACPSRHSNIPYGALRLLESFGERGDNDQSYS